MFGRNCPSSRISCEVPGAHEAHFLARVERALHDAHVGHDAAVVSYLLSKTRARNGAVGLPLRRRDFCDDRLEDLVDRRSPALALTISASVGVEADHRLDFLEHFVDPRRRAGRSC